MPTDCISFRDTSYFSSFICDYLDESPELKVFYNRFPKLENFKYQIEEKTSSYDKSVREVLTNQLEQQYQHIETSELTLQNIESIRSENTFTITTGHQLNLFTGPLYFLHKIISTINLTKALKTEYPDYNFESAGTNQKNCQRLGTNYLTEEALLEAEKIYVMENKHLEAILKRFGNRHFKKIEVLNIRDIYDYGDSALIQELEKIISFSI